VISYGFVALSEFSVSGNKGVRKDLRQNLAYGNIPLSKPTAVKTEKVNLNINMLLLKISVKVISKTIFSCNRLFYQITGNKIFS